MEIYSAVILGILSSICSNFGSNLQKYGFKHNSNSSIYWKNKYWVYGLIINIFGTICDFIALNNAAQSIIVCLSGFGLVSNIFFTKYWLDEEVKLSDVIGVSFIATGSTLSVLFGNLDSKHFTNTELISFYSKPGFIFYYILTLFVISFLAYRISIYNQISDNIDLDNINVNSEKYWLIKSYDNIKSSHSLYLCIVSGTLCGFSMLHGKILLEEVFNNRLITFNFFNVFILIQLIVYLIGQQHYLTIGLKNFDAKFIIPVFHCFFILNSIISGAIYFEELDDFTFMQSIVFIFGIIIILMGVRLLSNHHNIVNDFLNVHKYRLINNSDIECL